MALGSSGLDMLLGSLGASGLTPVSWGREGRPQPFQTAVAVLRRWTTSRQLALWERAAEPHQGAWVPATSLPLASNPVWLFLWA